MLTFYDVLYPESIMGDTLLAAGPLSGLQSPAPSTRSPSSQLRRIDDALAMRSGLYDSVLRSATEFQPIVGQTHTLALADVAYRDDEPDPDRKSEKDALLRRRSVARRLYGTWQLKDNETGAVLDQKRQVIANVPHVFDSGSFIRRGTRYVMGHQQRLRPGAYVRHRKNGESEAHFNVKSGTGPAHRYVLRPETGQFYIQLQHAHVPLVPLLESLGAERSDIEAAWGKELTDLNYAKKDPKALGKLYERLVPKREQDKFDLNDPERMRTKIRGAVDRMELDPEVTSRTLGRSADRVDADLVLRATKRVLDLARGDEEADDRDHPAYASFHGPEHLFSERIKNDYGRLQKELLRKASRKGSLSGIPSGALDRQIDAAIFRSGLAASFDKDTSVLTRRGFILWSDVRGDDEFACMVDGRLEYHRAAKLYEAEYSGDMIGFRGKVFSYLVTPTHRLWTRHRDTQAYRFEIAEAAFGKTRVFQTGLPEYCGFDQDFVVPAGVNLRHGHELPAVAINGDDWAEFLGWYLAEGWVSVESNPVGRGSRYRMCISQSLSANPEHCAEIEALLNRLPFRWTYNRSNSTFFINSKTLGMELLKYGKGCGHLAIPRYCFEWSSRRLKLFAAAFQKGDGNEYNGHVKYETTSLELARGLVEVVGRLGGTGRMSKRLMSAKNSNWKDSYIVSFGEKQLAQASSSATNSRRGSSASYFRQGYSGKVYGALVPGRLLYVMRDGKPHWSGDWVEAVPPGGLGQSDR